MEREQLVGEGNSDSDSEVAGTSKGTSDEHAVPEQRVSEGDKEPPHKCECTLVWGLLYVWRRSPAMCQYPVLLCAGNR